jgi:PAS domain S-box-containing protein
MNKQFLTEPALDALLRAPSLAVLAVDKQGCVLLWSPSASRMFGWTESEVLGRFLPIVPEEQRQVVYDRIQAELKGELTSALDVRRLRKDGLLLDVSLWTTPLRDSNGEVIGILALYADLTERKRAERALQEHEAEMRRMLAAVSDCLYSGEFDSDGRFSYHYYSPAAEQILGRPPEFFLAGPERWLSTVYPEDRPRLAQAFARLQSGQSASEEDEYRVVLPDGAIRWVRDSVTISQGTDGRRFVNGVVSNVTARKHTEEALRVSEDRYRTLTESAADAVFIIDRDDRVEFLNTYAASLLGSTPKELTGKRRGELFPPDTSEHQRREIEAVFESGRLSHTQNRITFEGGELWLDTQLVPLRRPGGEVRAVMGVSRDVTEQKRAEAALRESEERYRLMIEAIPHPAWRANAQGEVTYVNGRWYEYTGQTPEESRGNGWMRALHPDDVGRVMQSVMQKVKDDAPGGEIYHIEYRLRRASDGSYRWHLACAMAIKDKDGRTTCWFGSAADFDDQKRAQEMLEERVRERTAELVEANEALRNSESKYRTLVEEIPAITYIAALDEASTTLYVSPQVEALLGLTLADYKANPHMIWQNHLHPDDCERVLAELQRSRVSGEPLDCEYRMLNHDGETVWFRDKAVVVRNEAGRPLFLQGVMFDITERRQAEETMRLQSTALESAANGIVITDREGHVLWVNPAFTELTGYELSEVIGKNLRVLKSGQHDEAFYQNLWRTVLSGQVWHGEIVNKRKDGSLYTEEMTIAPVRNAAGKITQFVAIKQDITEWKLAEQSQQHLAAIVESSEDAIVSGDLDGTISSWNAGAQRLYNYAPEEILGRPVSVLVPRNRRGELREILKKLQCGGHIQHFETVRLKKGGIPVDVSITVSPIKNGAGQVIGISATTHDITERKRAEEALQKSEAQYRALVETTDTGFVILDREGRVLDANAEYVRLAGHRGLDEIRGRSIVEWTAGPDKERNAEGFRTCLKNGHIRNLEVGHVDSHGKVTPVEINATVEKNRGMLRVVTLCRDITERKELEQAVVEASSREQRRIGLDLHDGLCQQLTGLGFLWTAIAQREAVRSLLKADEVTKISGLISNAISEAHDLSRALCPVELESGDLGVSLQDLGLSMERLYAVPCVVRCQRPELLADKTVATHLYRVAQEAISNAIRHGKATRVWVHLVWKKNQLTLRIRDNGSGFSLRRGLKEGIGIRSMKYRAQVIGGSLTIESERGAGTTIACVWTQPRSRFAGKARRRAPG